MATWLIKGILAPVFGVFIALPPAHALARSLSAAARPPARLLPDFTALARKVAPTVVFIRAVTVSAASDSGDQPHKINREYGAGSILSTDGYILTNYHLVENANSIEVQLFDKQRYLARLVGFDKPTDLALLKINVAHLTPIEIGNSANLPIGTWVATLGVPFGLGFALTQGIISAEGRYLPGEPYVPFFWVDTMTNPGNSGGPLFDLEGRVIGVTSQIYGKHTGNVGFGMATPINIALSIVRQLRLQGQVTRGSVGIESQALTPELAASFGLRNTAGAVVTKVEPGSAAAQAGLAAGDVILRYGGQPVTDGKLLPALIAQSSPGSTQQVVFLRSGQAYSANVQVTAHAPSRPPALLKVAYQETPMLGMTLGALSADRKKALHLDHGLQILDVQAPAAIEEINPGDVLLAVGNVSVDSVQQLAGILAYYQGYASVPVLVLHNGRPTYLSIRNA